MSPALHALWFAALFGLGLSCNSSQLASQADAQEPRHPSGKPVAPPDAGSVPAKNSLLQPVQRDQLVRLMLDPGIRDATPEHTASRLSPFGEFTRSSMFPDQLDLRTENATQRALVEYVQGKSGFQFAHLRVAFWSAAGAELKTTYDAIDAQLAKALGKPQWTKKVRDSLPSRAYRVDKKLTIVLGEGLEKGKAFVRVELGELQGERE
jgi:hypothetical protein